MRKFSLAQAEGEQHKFLRVDHHIPIGESTTISFRFNTHEKKGLIFFGKHGDPIDTMLAIAISDGTLVVYTKLSGEFIPAQMNNLADGRWHYVNMNFRPNKIQVSIDDQLPITRPKVKGAWRISPPFFFGGVSEDMLEKIHFGMPYARTQFTGCIADFTINDEVVNFDQGLRNGVTLSSCNAVTSDTPRLGSSGDTDMRDQDPFCKLKYGPTWTYDHLFGQPDSAYRYGSWPHTRGERSIDPRGRIRNDTIVEFEFRVGPYFSDGTLFLAATSTPAEKFDYVLIYMTNGMIKAKFYLRNAHNTVMIPSGLYNDGKYHRLKFERRKWNAALIVDDVRSADVQDKDKSEHLDKVNMLFIGGMRRDHMERFANKFPKERSSFLSFPGCIKNVVVNGEHVTSAESMDRVLPCSATESVEDGTYFGYSKNKRSWLELNELKITSTFRISMNVR